MDNPTAVLDAIAEQIANVLDPRMLAGLSEDDLLSVLAATERAARRIDALRVLTAGEVAEQSRNELGKCGLAARKGCRNSAELVERVTQVSGDTARKRIKTGRAVRARLSLAGERLHAEFAAVAAALTAGSLGLDSAHAIVQGLTALTHPVGRDVLQAAETELVAAATGATETSPVPCAADDIRSQIVFDQHGRIPELGSPERIFTAQQRKAIILRDGQCCTPGCGMPGALSEIHHVDPAGNDGPTHTDNGMVLCWFRHRTLDSSGWAFRMVGGLPEVKYPPWLDDSGKWYRTGRSATLRHGKNDRKRRQPTRLM